MSAIGFDALKFARKLKAAGVPEQQAEAQAEVLGEAFLYNLDEIVTRDYLDARLEKLYSHIDSRHGLHSWMLGVIIIVNVIPVLSELLS